MALLRLNNKTARSYWLASNGLGIGSAPDPELGAKHQDLLGTIKRLGFVQLDTIQVVARAHHHILWSRNHHYREDMLDDLMAKNRAIFEHFTHDASLLPMDFLPYWQRQFNRKKQQLDRAGWFKGLPNQAARNKIKDRIRSEGPLSTHAFDTKIASPKQMWARPPHKLALDYMWYSGELATSHRINFTKYYDLAERVFPDNLANAGIDDDEQINWLCTAALDRLGFGSAGDIQRFWDAVSSDEVAAWVARSKASFTEIEIESASGEWITVIAPNDIEDRLSALKPTSSSVRILNPFDPAIRDRNRLSRLFGFDYRVEMFVPAAKRVWGYYVFPILEGNRFVGRIEVKADRKKSLLRVINLWPENGTKWPASRHQRLATELERMRKFTGVSTIEWD
ncbi:winged helix DNA-binding domain-containing protein [Alphaproteobacteria bacterium]|nr:winged helix DNA-binding domain-containing protein [Alphaproteobacteria bacterium]